MHRGRKPWGSRAPMSLSAGAHHHGIGPFHPTQRFHQGLFEAVFEIVGQQVHDDFGVHGGLKDGPLGFQFAPQPGGIHQVAVVGDAVIFIAVEHQKRLGIGQQRRTGGGIAHMTDGQMTLRAFSVCFLEDLADQPHVLVFAHLATVGHHDPGAFLAAVLQGVESEVGELGRIRMVVDAENTAFLSPSSGDNDQKRWSVW